MTIQRTATAQWDGDLKTGSGKLSTESGALDGVPYDAPSRFEEGGTTNPEELIGAAHAGCYSMALANVLDEAGHTPDRIDTEATVELDMSEGPTVTKVTLSTRGRVPGIDQGAFESYASKAKQDCPVSRALAALEIELEAELVS